MNLKTVLKTASSQGIATVADSAVWGGYVHARIMERLLRHNKPQAAPPDLAQVQNVLLAGTRNVAIQAVPSMQTALASLKARSDARSAAEITRVTPRIVGQLQNVAQLPPIPPEYVWQDMPFGKGLYLIEQPWYRSTPPEFRQVMQALGMERSAASFSGFSGAPSDPVFDVELARQLQQASGNSEMKLLQTAPFAIKLAIAAVAVGVAALAIGGGYALYQYGATRELSIRAADELDRRQKFQSTVENYYGPMADLCRRQSEAGKVDIATCRSFLPPLETESSLAKWQSGSSCGLGACAQYAGFGALLGILLGAVAAAKYTQKIPTVRI